MATAKKKTTKKKTTKATENVPALVEARLTSAALASHANYDMEAFNDVSLDVADNNELFQNDILIPKVWLVQAMSELRKEKKADEGQFVDSQTGELLADNGEQLNFVVLKTFKRWQTFKMVQDGNKIKKEFVSSEIMVLGKNHALPYQETIEGEDIVRRQVISAYILLERDATAGLNKPYIIDFAASSKLAGRKLISDIKTLNNNKLPSFVSWFKMDSKEENFEDGNTFVKDVNFDGYLPKNIIPFLIDCKNGLDTLENQIEIDDADVIDAAASTGKKQNANVNKAAASTDAGI